MPYTPPHKHRIDLNFEQLFAPANRHNIVLNFGESSAQINSLNAVVDTRIQSQISGTNTAIQVNSGLLLGSVDTRIRAEISGTNWENVDNRGTLLAVIDTSIHASVSGINDINNIRGIEAYWISEYQRAKPCLIAPNMLWAKPIFRAHNSAFYFERGLTFSNQVFVGFDKAAVLHRAIKAIHEQTTGLSSCAYLKWEETEKRFISLNPIFEESKKLKIHRIFDWVELVRKRKTFTYSHQVAHVFEKRFAFEWDKGLELITTSDIAWDKAKAIHYRKHPIQPWPKPVEIIKRKLTNLNFCCPGNKGGRFDIQLNFEEDKCAKAYLTAKLNRKWWYILNSLSVIRLDNGEKINVLDGNYSTDRSRWCWSYSLIVSASEINKLEPIAGQPVILKIMVNGNEHHMLLESRNRSRRFAQDTYTLTGRSQSALLDAPSSPTRSFLQENERTSVQLAQAELDRVNSNAQLDWKLIDELGWILPINSLSYSNFTPIAAIKLIVESAGGFIYSEKNGNTLSIRPLYKKTFWDPIVIADYDRLVPISLVKDQSTDYEVYPDYNGITLSNDRSGLTGQVKRTGTSADTLLETANDSLFTVESMGAFGKAKLAKAGMVEKHSLNMPISAEVGECVPGELIAFNAEWWGIVDSVSVSFNHAAVNQTIKIERVNRDE